MTLGYNYKEYTKFWDTYKLARCPVGHRPRFSERT